MKTQALALSIIFSTLLFCSLLQAQITGVTAGTDLTGGGTSGNVTLNLDTTKVPRLAAANSFTGNQTVKGNVSASAFEIGSNLFAFGSESTGNVFLGFAGNTSTSASANTAVGAWALSSDTSGQNNSALGWGALPSNTTGNSNNAIGLSALASNTTGGANVAEGVDTLFLNTSGSFNVAVGYFSDITGVTGSRNTFVGYNANPSTDPLNNAAAIGAEATVGESNAMILGGTGQNAVTVGIGTGTPYNDYALDVDTTNSNGTIDGGVVVNANGGNLYLGMTSGVHKFRVDTNGVAYADGGFYASGADFAESVAVRGPRSQYEPGDVLQIDTEADGHLALSQDAYATTVAGIYSTKPGVLATPHTMDDPAPKLSEVPLAVIGIVPCKVTTENGPIARGDLLVTSSRPGFAMKGTDRGRMLGAVVGKALEPLTEGRGVIQVLVTLQ